MGVLKWAGVLILLAAIITLSFSSGPAVKQHGEMLLRVLGTDSPVIRRWVLSSPQLWHVVLYALLTLAFATALPARPWRAALLALAVAALLEAAQVFVPTREAHFSDFLFSTAGVCGAAAAWRLGEKKLKAQS